MPELVPHVLPAGVLSSRAQLVAGFHRQKTGFALEGTRVRSLLHDDGWHDMHLHGRVSTA